MSVKITCIKHEPKILRKSWTWKYPTKKIDISGRSRSITQRRIQLRRTRTSNRSLFCITLFNKYAIWARHMAIIRKWFITPFLLIGNYSEILQQIIYPNNLLWSTSTDKGPSGLSAGLKELKMEDSASKNPRKMIRMNPA